MSLEKLTESSCVACREDAPLVTQEEFEERTKETSTQE